MNQFDERLAVELEERIELGEWSGAGSKNTAGISYTDGNMSYTVTTDLNNVTATVRYNF